MGLISYNKGGAAAQVVDDIGNPLPVSATISQIPLPAALVTEQAINFAGAGDNIIVAAVAAQTTKVYGLRINVQGATILQVKNGAGTVLETWDLPGVGAGFILDYRTQPYYKTSINTAFILNSSNAVQVNGVAEFLTGI